MMENRTVPLQTLSHRLQLEPTSASLCIQVRQQFKQICGALEWRRLVCYRCVSVTCHVRCFCISCNLPPATPIAATATPIAEGAALEAAKDTAPVCFGVRAVQIPWHLASGERLEQIYSPSDINTWPDDLSLEELRRQHLIYAERVHNFICFIIYFLTNCSFSSVINTNEARMQQQQIDLRTRLASLKINYTYH